MNYIFIALLFNCVFSTCLEAKTKVSFLVSSSIEESVDVERYLDLDQFEYVIHYEDVNHSLTDLAKQALFEKAQIVAVVGGDAAVNSVGTVLLKGDVELAIVPTGKGNGIAIHHRIPMGLEAIKVLNHSHVIEIDAGKINDMYFFGTAGIGFDSHIVHEYVNTPGGSHSQIASKEFSNYYPQPYEIKLDGKVLKKEAFMLTFANCSFFGNSYVIAPDAKTMDGVLDLILVDNVPFYAIPKFVYQLKKGTLDQSSHYERHPFKELVIEQPIIRAQVDGKPIVFHDRVKVESLPHSLKLRVPYE